MSSTSTAKLRKIALSADSLEHLLGYHLRRASKLVQADLAQTLAPFDLRMITFSALSLIAENLGLRQSELADVLEIERPNLVLIIDELENRALIDRNKVPSDRRAYALAITPKGQELLQKAQIVVNAHEARLFANVDKAALIEALLSLKGGRDEA